MASNVQKHKRKPKKRRRPKRLHLRKFFSVAASVFTLIGITGFLLWYFSFDTIIPEEIIQVSYSGYHKKGTAILSVSENSSCSDLPEIIDLQLLSENGNLKNGDFLDIRLIYKREEVKAHGLRIKEDTCRIEVTGLPKGIRLSKEEIFEPLEIVCEGTAPLLTVSVQNTGTEPFFQTIQYELTDSKAFYDLGETITVKAHISEEEAVCSHYILPDNSKELLIEYPIKNRDRYLRDATELTPEHIDTLNQSAGTLFGKADEYGLRIFSEAGLMPIWINGKTTFVWSNPRLISVYLNRLKPEYFESASSHNNDVKLVYLATLSQADGVACDAEVVVQFNDLIRKADGSYDLSLDSGQIVAASFKDSHIKDLVNATYNKQYESEKLFLN